MFEKLLSLLPYNPGLAHQMAFYSRRMREEASIRRIGLVFIVLAFLVQFFAVISPPQSTVAASSSDLINGGFSAKSEAVDHCRQNDKKYATILSSYGINCDDVANSTITTIKSTDYDKTLYTMGWNPDGPYNYRTNKPTNEVAVDLPNLDKPMYWHLVLNQDTGAYTNYKVLKLKSHLTGKTFYILYHCGNLVSVGVPPVVVLCPQNGNILKSDSRCFEPCRWNTSIPNTPPNCHPPLCPQDKTIYVTDAKCKACPQDNTILKTDKRCVQCPNPRYPTVTASSPKCKPVCPYNSSLDKGDAACKPCTSSKTSSDSLACVQVSKTASDPTQNWPDANAKTAQPGDTIIYTLYAKNSGKATVTGFVMQENLSDVLDYATVVDLDGAKIEQASGQVTWPAVDIKAGATLSHKITVKVKDPIPATPVSQSDGSHFDLIMTNVYGNSINIAVPAPPVKQIEVVTASTLPNTGPGTSLFVAAAIMIVAGYFFARARLLSVESELALHESTGV